MPKNKSDQAATPPLTTDEVFAAVRDAAVQATGSTPVRAETMTVEEYAMLLDSAAILSSTGAGIPYYFRGEPSKVVLVGMYAHVLRLPLVVALNTIFITKDKPTMSVNSWLGLIRRDGHSVTVDEWSYELCTVSGIRADTGDAESVTYTRTDMIAEGIAHTHWWKKTPKSLLHAKAVTVLGRILFTDVAPFGMYTPQEIDPDQAVAVPAWVDLDAAIKALPDLQRQQILDFVAKYLEGEGRDPGTALSELPFGWIHGFQTVVNRAVQSVEGTRFLPTRATPTKNAVGVSQSAPASEVGGPRSYGPPTDPVGPTMLVDLATIPEYVAGGEPF